MSAGSRLGVGSAGSIVFGGALSGLQFAGGAVLLAGLVILQAPGAGTTDGS